jgi:pseudaminic acid synthase
VTAPELAIAGRRIGPAHPVYVVAELSGNHNGRFERAEAILRAAHAAGADAVKLQTYTPDTITIDCDAAPFRIGGGTLWDGRTLHALYREASTPWEWHAPLARLAAELGMQCFSSPFDETAVEFLEQQGAPAYKIASFELVDLPLLARVARTGKPVIVSTGMATLPEIEEAIGTLRAAGAREVAVLRASSAYPAPAAEMHLRALAELTARFGVVTGLSDHTLGTSVAVAAVALGASIVEKHLTLARADGGPDAAFSLEPHEFRALVDDVRVAHQALGEARFGPTDAERASLAFRRSLFVVEDVKAGEQFTARNVRSIRPASGLHTRHLPEVLGRRASRDVARGTPLSWDLVS